MLSPRRLARRHGAARRDRPREGPALSHPRAGGRARARHRRARRRARRPPDLYVALHANHPRELTAAARAAFARLVDAGIAVVSQTVLLRGVNDDADDARGADARLRRGARQALLPAPRRPGARHRALRTSIARGQALMRELRGRLSGLALADLRARHPRRPRQGAGRPGLSRGDRRHRHRLRPRRRATRLRGLRAATPPGLSLPAF